MSIRNPIVYVIVLAFVMAGYVEADSETEDSRQRTMNDLFGGLVTAFDASLGDDRFADESNRKALRDALEQLSCGSEDLLAHGKGFGKSTQRLREAMAYEAGNALKDFDAGQFRGARRRVRQLLEHCFACHTRLPAADRPGFGAGIAQGVSFRGLDTEDRVVFLVATRQFDQALATIESALRSPGKVPTRHRWMFEAYLKLSIRVNRSYPDARDALKVFLEKSNPPRYLEARVRTWIRGLEELEGRELPVDPSTARRLIEEGRRLNEFPADNRGLVHFVAASGLLQQYLQDRGGENAEAYFLLGVAESHISSGLWTDQTDFFLETAIRERPHSPLATRAYGFLLEYVIAKHSSATETFVPDSVQTRLDDLAALAGPATPPRE